ncbi:sensor histidine kinase [Beggiatoa leptomitoformis]|uniref:histidine kinase n=1 Tax=Beggiatoa leptomitoformis TaxID=288004 RepID=A0A2N9YEM3_9GAMM|nr:sensor histidine kinase [Beggiatoa leptomitoformis]ALG68723.1 hypothetical protein AL038_14695 [Beggiatoa leptomitoformis]AUI68922.1 hypothetical protein BLE401_09560 [Beggiatoa leptomitoformis]
MEKKELHWKFDISTFRLLGRELITDRITAIVELVKNAYDANATIVHVRFFNTAKEGGKIIIEDDGIGMSQDDIENKWMRIGTNTKRVCKFSPEPFRRRVVGEKGIGRFAIDKLGSFCTIKTKKENTYLSNQLIIDWSVYESQSENYAEMSFTEMGNLLIQQEENTDWHGTTISIEKVSDSWSRYDIERTYKELSKLVSPLSLINNQHNSFNIYISSNDINDYQEKAVFNHAISYASQGFKITSNKKTQEVLKFNKDNMTLDIVEEDIHSFGSITFQFFYFTRYEKSSFTKNYKGEELQIDGIKVYRDGILTTPFMEYQENPDLQRDILGIEQRRWSGAFDKVSSRDLIGIVEISRDDNPKIIDATNRQDFLDNQEYRDFKKFVIAQLHEFEKLLTAQKQSEKKQVEQSLQDATKQIGQLTQDLGTLRKTNNDPNKIKQIQALEKIAQDAKDALKKSIRVQKAFEESTKKRETLLLSLMSLQTYALEIIHIVNTSIGKIKQRAEYLVRNISEQQKKDDEYVFTYSQDICYEMERIAKAIKAMDTYANSGNNWGEFEVKKCIEGIFASRKIIIDQTDIQIELDIEPKINLTYSEALLETIILNLFTNSSKALVDTERKKIKCIGYNQDNNFVIIFSDNGCGIPDENKTSIFEIYFTTTRAQEGLGLGLYVIKTYMDAIKGSIELIDSEYTPGASFKLTFPYQPKVAKK